MRILGIDPGLRNLGWGVIESVANKLNYVACGTIKTDPEENLANRLAYLYDNLINLLDKFQPEEVSVEYVFVNKDAQATLKLGQARGICLLAPAQRGLIIAEYAPNQIKKTILGVGHAGKEQIRYMIKHLLPKAELGNNDSSDALAIALCHFYHLQSERAYKIRELIS
ncbi:crossover junction endodeoxyribonuclease RuvC [Bartonella sp. DGB1]|uniref:crossover junction endodeoxyribonuclease RuvC n=1 Tax=Bartonella sp. DGB1 TaxID=3239807 RepID=UPI0035251700